MSLKVDFAFKELMNNDKVRKGFIAAVLHIDAEDIILTTILNTYLRKEHKDDKLGILDVRVEMNGNIEIDIEIQVVPFKYWAERTLFYNSKMYVETIEAGKKYSVLKKVISISILNFNLLDEKDFYNSFHIRNDKTYSIFTDMMEWHTIELLKLPENIKNTNDLLELWAGFIKKSGEDKELIKMIATKNTYLQAAYDELEKISADKQKRMEYEARQKALYAFNTSMEEAEQRGIEQGIAQGIAQGIEKGKYEIAKEALKLGVAIEVISKMTGIPEEEIKSIN